MKTAFFGAGNMGGAILGAAIETGAINAEDITVFDKNISLAEMYRDQYGVSVSKNAKEAAANAQVLVIAVKPNIVSELIKDIKDEVIKKDKYIVSIAAGVQVDTYIGLLNNNIKLVRTIPNLPAMVREGFTGIYYHNFDETDQDKEAIGFIWKLFNSLGKNIIVDQEIMIDEMVAVTSSSPAYVCLMIEAMADAAVLAGFSRKDAYIMTEQTVMGTAKLMLEEDVHPAVLKDRICSPGGTTIEAVASLEKTGFRNSLLKAMEACRNKTYELGNIREI